MAQMVIDANVPDRSHRKNIFNAEQKYFGCASGPHKDYKHCSVLIFTRKCEPLVKGKEQQKFINEVWARPPPPGVSKEIYESWQRLGALKISALIKLTKIRPKWNDNFTIATTTYSNGGGTYGQVSLDDQDISELTVLVRTVTGHG